MSGMSLRIQEKSMFKKRKDSQIKVKIELLSGQVTPHREETAGFGEMSVISEM